MVGEVSTKPAPPPDYRPKRGGRRPSWFPKITVYIKPTPDDAAYYKARMGERIAESKAKL